MHTSIHTVHIVARSLRSSNERGIGTLFQQSCQLKASWDCRNYGPRAVPVIMTKISVRQGQTSPPLNMKKLAKKSSFNLDQFWELVTGAPCVSTTPKPPSLLMSTAKQGAPQSTCLQSDNHRAGPPCPFWHRSSILQHLAAPVRK